MNRVHVAMSSIATFTNANPYLDDVRGQPRIDARPTTTARQWLALAALGLAAGAVAVAPFIWLGLI